MPKWIHKLSTPEVLNDVSIFNYNTTAQIYPEMVWATPTSFNENIFTNRETISVDGQRIPAPVDFSGIGMGPRKLGDGGSIYCRPCTYDAPECYAGYDVCQSLPWPRCVAQYKYSKLSNQGGVNGGIGCLPIVDYLEELNFQGPDGRPFFPIRLIPVNEADKAVYWNDLNLWYNGTYAYSGSILLKNDGPRYEDGGEEYLLRIGHSISSDPCSEFGMTFFDKNTNQFIYRVFECACKRFLPEEQHNLCRNLYDFPNSGPLYTDGNILMVMKRGQEPIPDSIKRYKMLFGQIPDNFPTYGVEGNGTVTKAVIKKNSTGSYVGRPDRNLPNTFGFSFQYDQLENWALRYIWLRGEGDDGGVILTTSLEGETIFAGFDGGQVHGTVDENVGVPIGGQGRCNSISDIMFLNEETTTVDINTWCLPNLYHPEEYNSNYPDFDNLELRTITKTSLQNLELFYGYNLLLEQLNKPKIVTYGFGNPIAIFEESPNLPNISEESEFNFPLKKYPYLSRESSNSIYQNTNLIDFKEQRMLQASELNELQEKFYRKQSLFIEYNKNWLNKNNLVSTNEDILGTSIKNNLYNTSFNINKIIPISKNLIQIGNRLDENRNIKVEFVINDGWYLLNSKYRGVKKIENTFDNFQLQSNTEYYDLNFIRLNSSFLLFDPDELYSLTPDNYYVIISRIDMINIISCNEYSDLKDNSNGTSSNAPCGANRNILNENDNYTLNMKKTPTVFSDTPIPSYNVFVSGGISGYFTSNYDLSPVNAMVSREAGAPYIIAYAKKEQNAVNLYLANGVLLQTFPLP
jgi:hypothetical protein